MLPKVYISHSDKTLSLSLPSVRRLVREVLLFKQKQTHEVSLYFVSEKKISQLHQKYFNDPTVTDCISLPLDDPSSDEPYHILGEIFICPQTAVNYIQLHGGDLYTEVTLYIVHGLLHLLGYDDMNPVDRRKMRYEEKKIMNHLTLKHVFLRPSLFKISS